MDDIRNIKKRGGAQKSCLKLKKLAHHIYGLRQFEFLPVGNGMKMRSFHKRFSITIGTMSGNNFENKAL